MIGKRKTSKYKSIIEATVQITVDHDTLFSEEELLDEFDAKVSETEQFQEIKILISSYNKMITEIENKQNELISKSNEDEEKRIFIEAILSLLTIGVISLDKDFNIVLHNTTVNKLFKNS